MNAIDTILHGDALEQLRALPDNSAHCCVTSPPYFGLRDYGVPGQIGLEASVEEYVARLVEVFAEVRRVLRDDGTLWLNLGDSYANDTKWGGNGSGPDSKNYTSGLGGYVGQKAKRHTGLKPKDLIGVPWRVAFALQAAGWWLRSDIIWAKPNPMPESVTDRPTRSHEYLFLLAKGQWVSRVIKFTNLPSECLHLQQHIGAQHSNMGPIQYCVSLATALLDLAQEQYNLGLPPLYSEVWQKSADGEYSSFVRSLPPIARFASAAARFYRGESSSKDFVQEIDSLWCNLANRDQLLIPRIAPIRCDAPSVYSDGDTTIAVNHSGQICKFDFVHDKIIAQVPTTCNYYYDADAIREEAQYGRKIAPLGLPRTGRTAQSSAMWRYAGDRNENVERGGNDAGKIYDPSAGRNKRTVWNVATMPYAGAHFATFPPKLIEPCILAGCPAGGVVLDPFFGTGTVGEVAIKHSRHYLGIELNAASIQLAKERLGKGIQRVLWSAS